MHSNQYACDPVLISLEEKLKRNSLILDLGCGYGRNSLYFHNKDHNVICVDKDISALFFVNKILSNDKRIKLNKGDILDFFKANEKNNYNLIILSQILNYFSEEEAIRLINLCKVNTKIGGYNYIKVFTLNSDKQGFMNLAKPEFYLNLYSDWSVKPIFNEEIDLNNSGLEFYAEKLDNI